MKIVFEYDVNKSHLNKRKHGIDFEEAKVLFYGATVVVEANEVDGESRLMAIGKIGGKHYSAVYTYRGKSIRLISVRRSRKSEEKIYEQNHG